MVLEVVQVVDVGTGGKEVVEVLDDQVQVLEDHVVNKGVVEVGQVLDGVVL